MSKSCVSRARELAFFLKERQRVDVAIAKYKGAISELAAERYRIDLKIGTITASLASGPN